MNDSLSYNYFNLSFQVQGNLTYVDGLIGDLIQGMGENGYGSCVNFVAVADHGKLPYNLYKLRKHFDTDYEVL